MAENQRPNGSAREGGRRRRAAALGSAGLVAGLIAATLAGGTAPAATVHESGARDCEYRDNVTVILDDSGSTAGSDQEKARSEFMSLFLGADLLFGAEPRQLAAVEFGTEAKEIFGPTRITDASAVGLATRIDDAMQSDEDLTNYNAAFAQANATNPTHDARVFFSDGEHNEGDFTNGHRPGPKTNVLGLNVTSIGGRALLDRIAAETGGFHTALDSADEAFPAVVEVFNDLSCLPAPKSKSVSIAGTGQTKKLIRFDVGSARSVQLVVSLQGVLLGIDALKFVVAEKNGIKHILSSKGGGASAAAKENCKDKKRKKGKAKKKKPKLKVGCQGDESFLVTQLSGKKGKPVKKSLGRKLTVKVKTPRELILPDGAKVTGQAAQTG